MSYINSTAYPCKLGSSPWAKSLRPLLSNNITVPKQFYWCGRTIVLLRVVQENVGTGVRLSKLFISTLTCFNFVTDPCILCATVL